MHNTVVARSRQDRRASSRSKSTGDAEKLKSFGKQVAMHIAAANPQGVDVAGLDPAFVERERAVLPSRRKSPASPAA